MRHLLILTMLSFPAAATTIISDSTLPPTPDILMGDSFICTDAMTLLRTKEEALAGYSHDGESVDVIAEQLRTAKCVVTEDDEDVIIKRLAIGHIVGIQKDMVSELIVQVSVDGKTMWTESVNLLNADFHALSISE